MARSFNGTSDRIGFAGIAGLGALVANGAFTLSVWLFQTSHGTRQSALADWNSAGSAQSIDVEVNASNVIGWNVGINSSNVITLTGVTASLSTWYNVILTYDGSTVAKASVNGALQTNTYAQNRSLPNGTTLTLGRGGAFNSLFFAGRLADLVIWKGVVLTANQIKAIAAGANPVMTNPGGIVLYLPLLGADSPEPDYSGSRRSGTLTGTATALHPPVQPGIIVPRFGFQPMPV